VHLRGRYAGGTRLGFARVTLRDLGTSASQRVARDLDRERLLETLASLPLHEQVALELYYWEEMSAPEIAETLGVPEGTVRTRIRSARLRLRRKLELRERPPLRTAR
jgi:RNA polymerase sigma factor (sigma-70 family)